MWCRTGSEAVIMANQYQKQFVPSVSGSKAESGLPGAEDRGAGKTEGAPEMPAGQFTITSEHEDTSDLPGSFTEKNGEGAVGSRR